MYKVHSLNTVIFTIIFFIAVFIPLKAEENNITAYSNEVAKVLQEYPITVEFKKLKMPKQDWATLQEIELQFTYQNMCGIPYSVFIVFKERIINTPSFFKLFLQISINLILLSVSKK